MRVQSGGRRTCWWGWQVRGQKDKGSIEKVDTLKGGR
jgi:hypothetical protein